MVVMEQLPEEYKIFVMSPQLHHSSTMFEMPSLSCIKWALFMVTFAIQTSCQMESCARLSTLIGGERGVNWDGAISHEHV